jgi:hypothetical protein
MTRSFRKKYDVLLFVWNIIISQTRRKEYSLRDSFLCIVTCLLRKDFYGLHSYKDLLNRIHKNLFKILHRKSFSSHAIMQ